MCFSCGFFYYFRLRAFCLCLPLLTVFLFQSARFGTPKRSKSTPKSRPNFDTAKGPNLPRFGCPLGSPKSPQNRFSDPVGAPGRSKIASWWPQLCLGAHLGLLMPILGPPGPIWTPPGDDFGSILVPHGPIWTPPRLSLAPRKGYIWGFLLPLISARIFTSKTWKSPNIILSEMEPFPIEKISCLIWSQRASKCCSWKRVWYIRRSLWLARVV